MNVVGSCLLFYKPHIQTTHYYENWNRKQDDKNR